MSSTAAELACRLPDISGRALVRLSTGGIEWCDVHPNIRVAFRVTGLTTTDGEVTELGHRTADLIAEEGA